MYGFMPYARFVEMHYIAVQIVLVGHCLSFSSAMPGTTMTSIAEFACIVALGSHRFWNTACDIR